MGIFEKLKGLFGGGGSGNGASSPAPARGASGEGVTCQEALERLFEYLDGELEGVTEEQVAAHFRMCQRCYPRLKFEETFQKVVRRVRKGQEPPEEVRRKVLQVLESEGLDSS